VPELAFHAIEPSVSPKPKNGSELLEESRYLTRVLSVSRDNAMLGDRLRSEDEIDDEATASLRQEVKARPYTSIGPLGHGRQILEGADSGDGTSTRVGLFGIRSPSNTQALIAT
jgi:hypothetical protein